VSELASLKLIISLYWRAFFNRGCVQISLTAGLIKAGLWVGVPLVGILKQPDLGTALVAVSLLLFVGAFLVACSGTYGGECPRGEMLVGAVFYPPVSKKKKILKPYQLVKSITSFLQPEDDARVQV